jgi:hypothetical protein
MPALFGQKTSFTNSQAINHARSPVIKGIINKSIDINFIKKPTPIGIGFFWGERWVSNPRPTDPQTVALTY